jgi:hypothetical protein
MKIQRSKKGNEKRVSCFVAICFKKIITDDYTCQSYNDEYIQREDIRKAMIRFIVEFGVRLERHR